MFSLTIIILTSTFPPNLALTAAGQAARPETGHIRESAARRAGETSGRGRAAKAGRSAGGCFIHLKEGYFFKMWFGSDRILVGPYKALVLLYRSSFSQFRTTYEHTNNAISHAILPPAGGRGAVQGQGAAAGGFPGDAVRD